VRAAWRATSAFCSLAGADYYNVTFRKGMIPFEAENICVVPGGRAGLSRLMSVISPIMLGYQVRPTLKPTVTPN
jgi:hypothetical protein